jgi:membrane-bound lytic murein transglycosylase B
LWLLFPLLEEFVMRCLAIVTLLAASACTHSLAPFETAQPVPPVSVGKTVDCAASALSSFQRPVQFASAAAWTPPPPMPPGPPNAPAYLAGPDPVLVSTGDPRIDAWRSRVFAEGGPGWRPYLLRAFAGVRANPAILASLEERPADIPAYVRRYVTPTRIATGQRLYRELQGQKLFEGEQKVPLEILLALWGVHSDYGANPPRFDMIEALANAGACGKGPHWGSFSIYQAAAMIAEGKVERSKAKAYANGRIGQNRLFTEQYLNWAEDGDGDGKVDIWTNRADILKNLQRHSLMNWESTGSPLVEIQAVTYNANAPNEIRRLRAAVGWEGAHKRIDGRPWPSAGESVFGWNSAMRLGSDGPTYLVSRDVLAIGYQDPFREAYYGEPAQGFGIAVALLAEQIAGRPGPSRPIR